ncbi:MAG: BatD family protein [Chthoniobacterales bacterium]|nr:BatD family protein [Chthoniobacterales bacterium]
MTIFLSAFFALFAPIIAYGQAPSVQAKLNREQISVGEVAILEIVVSGSTNADIPPQINIDGLEIHPRAQSTQVQIINFQSSIRVSRSYEVRPLREGDFVIPSISVRVGRQVLQTQPLRLRVIRQSPSQQAHKGSAIQIPAPTLPPSQGYPPLPPGLQSPGPQVGNRSGNEQSRPVWMELILPEGPLYVGQRVPVELRIYLDQRFQFDVHELGQIMGEGFVAEKFSEPQRRTEVRNGISYEVASLQTTLSPVKAGNLQIPPIRAKMSVISSGQFPGSSIWEDFFGFDPFGMFDTLLGQRREFEVESNGVSLEVHQPPKEGQPPDFTGAIGQFQIRQRVEPARSEVGEPIKLIVEITGSGNFNAIQPPELEETDGWRVYSGSDNFQPMDSVGFSGKKTFEITIVSLREVQLTPSAKFTYFDPTQKKYVTLRADPQPVLVRGKDQRLPSAQQPPQVAVSPTPPSPTVKKAEDAKEEKKEEQNKKLDLSFEPALVWRKESFVPLPFRTEFLIANSAALLSALAFTIFLLLRRAANSESARIAKIRKEQQKILSRISREPKDTRIFLGEVWDFLRLESALRMNLSVDLADAHSLLESTCNLPADLVEDIRRILSACDEARFASRAPKISGLEHQQILQALRRLNRTQLPFHFRKERSQFSKTILLVIVGSTFLFCSVVCQNVFASAESNSTNVPTHQTSASTQLPGSEISQDGNFLFEQGLDAYAKNDWESAKKSFLLANSMLGPSPEIFYNLGISQASAGEIAAAVASLLRSQMLDLSFAPSRLALEELARRYEFILPKRNLGEEIARILGVKVLWILGSVFFWTSIFLILFGLLWRKKGLVAISIAALIFSGAFFLGAGVGDPLMAWRNFAVVESVRPVPLRITPNENAGGIENLPVGSIVRENLRRGKWAFVETMEEKKGWVPTSTLHSVLSN